VARVGAERAATPPRFVGRAVVALATDPDLLRLSGGVYKVGELARRYGFTDLDGSQPEPFRMPEGFDKPMLPVETARSEASGALPDSL